MFGFTLIELLIVIAILAIIGSVVAFRLANSTNKARDGIRKANLGQIASALEQYYTDNGFRYIPGNFTSESGDNWIPNLNPYFKTIPKDPKQAGIISLLAGNFFGGVSKASQGQVAAVQTITLRPNGVGNRTGVTCMLGIFCSGVWQTQSPASGDHWDKLAEAVSDEHATYVESIVDGQWDGYTHPASGIPVGSTISNVKICVRAMSFDPPPWYDEEIDEWVGEPLIAAPAIISGNVLYYDDFNINGSYSNVCRDWVNDPNGNVAWTVAAVDSAQIAMRKSYSTHTRVTQAWMEVTYDPDTAPTPTPPVPTPTPTPPTTPTPTPTPTPSPGGDASRVYYYGYYSDPAGTYYELWAQLEDTSDPLINTAANAKCKLPVPPGAPIDFNYCVSSHR